MTRPARTAGNTPTRAPMRFPTLAGRGPRPLIIGHPEAVNGLDPETGKVYWSQNFKVKANLTIATPRLSGDKLLVTSFYNGAMLLKLAADRPAATVVWQSKGRGEAPEQT